MVDNLVRGIATETRVHMHFVHSVMRENVCAHTGTRIAAPLTRNRFVADDDNEAARVAAIVTAKIVSHRAPLLPA